MNYPKTTEEQLIRLKGKIPEGAWRGLAHDMSFDWDDKYDQSFGRVEQAIERENNQE